MGAYRRRWKDKGMKNKNCYLRRKVLKRRLDRQFYKTLKNAISSCKDILNYEQYIRISKEEREIIILEKRIQDLERINAEQKIKIDTLLKQIEYLEGELCIK